MPSDNCEEDAIQQRYIQVVEQFGTHYTTEVVMGAKAVQEFRFKNSDLDRFQSVGISAKVSWTEFVWYTAITSIEKHARGWSLNWS